MWWSRFLENRRHRGKPYAAGRKGSMKISESRRRRIFSFLILMLSAVALLCLPKVLREPVAPPGSVASASSTLCTGDANLDGLRDVRDQVLIQAHILQTKSLSGEALTNADVNLDGEVDVLDIVGLLRNNLGFSQLAQCDTAVPAGTPEIRFITPNSGPRGSIITLFGENFSPVLTRNLVFFSRLDKTKAGEIISATTNSLVVKVPEDLGGQVYRVAVGVLGLLSNGVGFQVRNFAAGVVPSLVVFPSSATILMPPGSGKETLVVGAGIPPYKLKPLSEADQLKLQATLEGTVIDLTGLVASGTTLTVRVEVEDSADPPVTKSSSIRIQEPRFQPRFRVLPHSLLAGSRPGFTIVMHHNVNEMRFVRTEIRMQKIEPDFSRLSEGQLMGAGRSIFFNSARDFQALSITEIVSPTKVAFEGRSTQSVAIPGQDDADGSVLQATGTLEAGSTVLTLDDFPRPPEEGVVEFTFDQEIILGDGALQLPDAVGESFDLVATSTSVPVLKGSDLTMTHAETLSFVTVAAPAGAPRLERILPVMGPVGKLLELRGSGFDPDPAANLVTFERSDGDRVEGAVESASPTELMVRVPMEAVTGPVRVTGGGPSSNDHQFFVLFRPEAGIFFPEFEAGQPVAPVILLKQSQSDRVLTVQQDVPLASLKVTLDQGEIRTDTLTVDEAAGKAFLVLNTNGFITSYLLVYGGQEEEGDKRHFFDYKRTLEGNSEATLFLSKNVDGEIVFELPSVFPMVDRTLSTEFEDQVYVPPSAPGSLVNTTSEVRSVQWSSFPESEMVVQFPSQVETQ